MRHEPNGLQAPDRPWRSRLHEVIFEADTFAGKAFDLILILSIALSVLAVVLDSVASVHARWGDELLIAEWAFTVLFSIEYALRIVSVRKPFRYVWSFFGMVDLLAILPTYISLVVPGSQYLLVIRVLRVLRIFRVLKLANYLNEARQLTAAMRSSRRKITVFLFTVLTLVVVLGSLMYMIEGEESGFTSIPQSVYWAIVTLTTVGYGDISPITPLGKALAAVVMILGYGIIAVPTGIVTVELSRASAGRISTQACELCGAEGHDSDAAYCKHCGARL
ncbi:voltage-gated potassium channel [Desulfomicrobium norvegicum]|uniref:Voltage-gated potassium channel n=1 Tax=Desulfomicrobium norvegicum (strain DSM 1741 / NCIMB 8310) TaxID=52561 RepID=A0A8G2C618_DESNO|nr:ion transporter [Desulfomicrobium norvegicum]SFM19096.1 voltage-gated potassium channel [Desulfomicrobium norvegicum]